ncbi:unnamed protein product [Prorocentrum cordatum]|uniref:Uncharacterized protein n=1 Tax=Prorocentrum cordatum TaxID=2364126 RepID=A0ABN9SDU4_9DINO|nr:unnamed protein product [Polarella glacialis]
MISSGGVTVLVVFIIRPCSSQGGTCHANCGTGLWPSLSTDWSIECTANPYCMFGCPECFTTTSETSSTTQSSTTGTSTQTSESSSTTWSTTTVSTTSESSSTTVSSTTGTSATVSTASASSRTTQSTTSVSSTTGTVTTVSTTSESSSTTVSSTTGTSATVSTTSASSRTTQSTTSGSSTTETVTTVSTDSQSSSTTVSLTTGTSATVSTTSASSRTTQSTTSVSSTTETVTTVSTDSHSSSTTVSLTTGTSATVSTTSASSRTTQSTTSVSSTTETVTTVSTDSESSSTTVSLVTGTSATVSTASESSITTQSTTSRSSTTGTLTVVSTVSESTSTTASSTTSTTGSQSSSTTVSFTTSSPTSSSTVSESSSTTVSSATLTTGSQSSSTTRSSTTSSTITSSATSESSSKTVSFTTSSPTSSSTVSESTSTTVSSATLTTGSQSSSTTRSSTTSSTITSSTTSESSSKTVSSTISSLTSSSTRSVSSTTTASSSSTTASATTRSTTSESSTTSTTVHLGPWWQQRGVLLLTLLSVTVAVMATFAGLWQSILRAECPYSDGTPEVRHTCLSAWDAHAAGTLPGHTRLSAAAIRVACCLSGVEVGREELAGRPLAESLGLVATLKCLSLLLLADAGVTGVDLRRLGQRAVEADPKSGAGRICKRLRRALRALERRERLAMGLGLEVRQWDLFYSLHPVLGLWVHHLGHGGPWLRRAVVSTAGLFASLACCALLLLAWAEGPVIAPCMLPDAGLWQELDLQTVLGDCGIAALSGLVVPVVTAAIVRAGGVVANVALLIGSVLVVLAFLANVCMVDVDHWIVAFFAQLALCWLLAPAAQVALCHAVCAHAAGRRPAVLLEALRCLQLAIAPGAAEKPSEARDAAQGSIPCGDHVSWARPPPGGSPMEPVLRSSAGVLLETPPRAPAICPVHAEAPDPLGRSHPPRRRTRAPGCRGPCGAPRPRARRAARRSSPRGRRAARAARRFPPPPPPGTDEPETGRRGCRPGGHGPSFLWALRFVCLCSPLFSPSSRWVPSA